MNTLPKTLSGLDVNINFVTGGFSNSPSTSSSSTSSPNNSELDLFKLAKVDFRHGWLASEDDKETYEVLLSVANDYDTAVNVLVEGDAIAEGNITGNNQTASSTTGAAIDTAVDGDNTGTRQVQPPPTVSSASRLEQLFEDLSMEPNKQAKVYQATVIQRFLQQTSTQLTYAGLFNLSESLAPNSLCALFRNSHFSVLYRRPDTLPQSQQTAQDGSSSNTGTASQQKRIPQATLFQLVTDQALLHESNAVWESLEDIDGSASSFFDSALQPARIRQDWVSRSERDPVQVENNNATHDAE